MMEFVNGKDYSIPYMKWKIIQLWIPWSKHPKNLENNHGFPRGMK